MKILFTSLLLICPILGLAQEIEDHGQTFEVKPSAVTVAEGEQKAVFSKTEPAVTLSKWNGDASPKIKYDGIDTVAQESNGTIKWKSTRQELHSFQINDVDGGIEIEILLKDHPDNNIFTFTISDYENLDFFYQAPLDQEDHSDDIRIASCTPNKCINAEGNLALERPDNVVGSYAVYHKTKRDHLPGQLNYKAGKAFHIFRPQAFDALGNKIWCDLKFNSGVLSVICPQDFLDHATYPVLVDPTFGYNSLGGSIDATGKFANANAVVASGSGDANPGTAYFGGAMTLPSTAGTVYVAIYDNGDGNISANNRLAVSSGIALDNVAAFRSAAITWIGIVDSTTYFIEAYSNTANVTTRYDTGTVDQYTSTGSTATPPDPHATRSGITGAVQKMSVYVDYTASGAAPTPGLFVNGNMISNAGMVYK